MIRILGNKYTLRNKLWNIVDNRSAQYCVAIVWLVRFTIQLETRCARRRQKLRRHNSCLRIWHGICMAPPNDYNSIKKIKLINSIPAKNNHTKQRSSAYSVVQIAVSADCNARDFPHSTNKFYDINCYVGFWSLYKVFDGVIHFNMYYCFL